MEEVKFEAARPGCVDDLGSALLREAVEVCLSASSADYSSQHD